METSLLLAYPEYGEVLFMLSPTTLLNYIYTNFGFKVQHSNIPRVTFVNEFEFYFVITIKGNMNMEGTNTCTNTIKRCSLMRSHSKKMIS